MKYANIYNSDGWELYEPGHWGDIRYRKDLLAGYSNDYEPTKLSDVVDYIKQAEDDKEIYNKLSEEVEADYNSLIKLNSEENKEKLSPEYDDPETINEHIRNGLGPFQTLIDLLTDNRIDESVKEKLISNCIKTCKQSMKKLVKLGEGKHEDTCWWHEDSQD